MPIFMQHAQKNTKHYERLCSLLVEDIKEDVRNSTKRYSHLSKGQHLNRISIPRRGQKRSQTWKQIVPACYHDFKDVFTKEEFDALPEMMRMGPQD